jgi:hypothetical protein
VNDKYPAYIPWQTYEQIRDRLSNNLAEYDRNKTRGIPRPGAALLHGIVYCGECGHKMVVQYKGGNHYLCNYLRQQYRVPVCQYIPADPIDSQVIQAFFKALSPIELNAYERAIASQSKTQTQIERAHLQQIERLRYQAALAERQYNQADPDNRLVTAELERRWERALRDLKQAEEAQARRQVPEIPQTINTQLKASFCDIGKQLPQLWNSEKLSRAQKKALLRALIDKVVIHRAVRDQIHTRIVWRGGDTTTLKIPIPVGAFSELSNAQTLEQQILSLTGQGYSDVEIAERLSIQGFRSPLRNELLPSTVKGLRLKHRVFRKRSQSHPRHIPGYLTVPQLAQTLNISKHWIYDRIHKGTIAISRDKNTGLYLFPDQPSTLEQLKQLVNGKLYNLRY